MNFMPASPIPGTRAAADPSPSPGPHPVRPSLVELFTAFARISLSGFGGMLAWSHRMMVEERKWLSDEQFNETYALCAFLPGGNILNFSVIFGARFRGAWGGASERFKGKTWHGVLSPARWCRS